jgi:putative ATPase
VSAFIKSLRGNDPDAALYWLGAMIAAGEDPRFIVRRLIISASEDVGNADPRALQVAVAAAQALDHIGLPEAQYAMAQATIFIASSPKSDSVGRAYSAALADVLRLGSLPVPNHLRTAGDRRMKAHGIGVGYVFPHDYEGDDVPQQYLPDELKDRRYYVPNDQGHETVIASRMAEREAARGDKPRRKKRSDPPMASMSDALRPRESARKDLAETQKRDAGDGPG